jgi:hypothetical protein
MSVEIRQCTHIKVNGTKCGSPALKTGSRCYFHDLATRRIRTGVFQRPALLPILEDANAIQIALMDVINDLRQELIEEKVAGKLLYALQIASLNLKQMRLDCEDSVQDLPADWQPMEPKGLPRWREGVNQTIEEANKPEGAPFKPAVGMSEDVHGSPKPPSNPRMGFDKLDPERAAELERIYRTYGTEIKACVEEEAELEGEEDTRVPQVRAVALTWGSQGPLHPTSILYDSSHIALVTTCSESSGLESTQLYASPNLIARPVDRAACNAGSGREAAEAPGPHQQDPRAERCCARFLGH